MKKGLLESLVAIGTGDQNRRSGGHQSDIPGRQLKGQLRVQTVGRRGAAAVPVLDLDQIVSQYPAEGLEGTVVLLG